MTTDPGRPADDLDRSGIADLLAEQAAGRLRALDVVESRLARTAAHADLGAVVDLDADAARAAARAVDARRDRGEPLGPLAGVPVTVKDSFEVAGLHACQGTADSVHRCERDAPAVALLRAAGAVVLGKTNLPPHLADLRSDNPVHGRTANPWDASRTPGGSSGGSAAAVSARLSWGDLASDLTGSIRVPSAWCGVFGHRPSHGLVSKRGHLPWPVRGMLDAPVSVAGPIAARADDLARLFAVLAAPVGTQARAWRLELPAPPPVPLPALRIGLWLDEPSAPVDAETAQELHDLADRLRQVGCVVRELGPSVLGTASAAALFDRLVAHEVAHGGDPAGGRRSAEDAAHAPAGAPVAQVWADWEAQLALREEWEASIAGTDVVLAPVTPFTAPRDGDLDEPGVREAASRWSCLVNLAAGPSTVIPVGLGSASHLPVAVQAVAPWAHDLHTLRFARLVEREGLVPALRPPGW